MLVHLYAFFIGVEPIDQKSVWLADAESAITNSAFETARAIYTKCIETNSSISHRNIK